MIHNTDKKVVSVFIAFSALRMVLCMHHLRVERSSELGAGKIGLANMLQNCLGPGIVLIFRVLGLCRAGT
jgi:hypothetical protein